MVSCPSRRGASFTVVTVVRRKLGALFRKVKATCSDCDRLTTSKSLRSGRVSSGWSPFDDTAAVIWRFKVPSSGTSSTSVRAETCTSSAANAAEATSRAAIALPVLLDIGPPLLRFLLAEPPDLEVLLARTQRIEEPLRFASIHRTVSRRLQFFLLPGLVLLLLGRLALLRLLLARRLFLARLVAILVLPGLLLLVFLLLLRTRLLLLIVLPGLRLLLLLGPAARLGLLLLALLFAQQELQVHLRVAVRRVELQRPRVGRDRLVRPTGLLQRVAQIVGAHRLERRVSLGQRAVRFLHRLGPQLGVARAEERGGPVVSERSSPRSGLGRLGLLVGLERSLHVAVDRPRVALRHVRLRLLEQPAKRAGGAIGERRSGRRHRLGPGSRGGPGGERGQKERDHAVLPRRSRPSPRAAAAQRSANAGQAT